MATTGSVGQKGHQQLVVAICDYFASMLRNVKADVSSVNQD
jgi:hypothetical protein